MTMLQECMRLLSAASSPEPERGDEENKGDVVDLTGSPVRAGAAPANPGAQTSKAAPPAQTAAAAAAAMQLSLSRMLFDPSKTEAYRLTLARQVKLSASAILSAELLVPLFFLLWSKYLPCHVLL